MLSTQRIIFNADSFYYQQVWLNFKRPFQANYKLQPLLIINNEEISTLNFLEIDHEPKAVEPGYFLTTAAHHKHTMKNDSSKNKLVDSTAVAL